MYSRVFGLKIRWAHEVPSYSWMLKVFSKVVVLNVTAVFDTHTMAAYQRTVQVQNWWILLESNLWHLWASKVKMSACELDCQYFIFIGTVQWRRKSSPIVAVCFTLFSPDRALVAAIRWFFMLTAKGKIRNSPKKLGQTLFLQKVAGNWKFLFFLRIPKRAAGHKQRIPQLPRWSRWMQSHLFSQAPQAPNSQHEEIRNANLFLVWEEGLPP